MLGVRVTGSRDLDGDYMVKIAGMTFWRPPKGRSDSQRRGSSRGNRARWNKRDTESWETLDSRTAIVLPRCVKCRNMVHPNDINDRGVCRGCR